MSAPVPFDPAAYVADMREAGAELAPMTITGGRRAFCIMPGASGGIPGDVLWVGAKWEAAALAHGDWLAAVHDALVAEGRPC